MRYLFISVAAALAVASAATIATAQDDKGKSGAEQQTPGAGQGADKAEKPQPKATQQGNPKRDQPKTTQQRQDPGIDKPKAAQQPQPGSEKQKSTQQRQDPAKDQPKAAQQPGVTDKPKSTQQQQDPAKDQPKAAQQPQPDNDKQKSTQQQDPAKAQPKTVQQDKADGSTQFSKEQRTNIRERLVKDTPVEKARINVTVNVGRAIPRSVRLHPLPVAIIAIAPAYRSYNYVVLEDETIVIVDPRTYVIVDVIDTGGRPNRAQFALSSEDKRFLISNLRRDRTTEVRVRLALGAEVPRNVELLTFPGAVVARVPDMQRYRYIVSGDDIVIVDPSDYSVVLVVND